MSDETQEGSVLNTDQQQRTHAAITAGEILRGAAPSGALSNSGRVPGDVKDIVDLANWLVTGDTYAVMIARIEHQWHVDHIKDLNIPGLIGFVNMDTPDEGNDEEPLPGFD